jgi:GTPase
MLQDPLQLLEPALPCSDRETEDESIKQLFGNSTGLKPNQIHRIQKLYERRVRPWQLVSPELARSLCELSYEVGRQIGVLLDRRGYVEWVLLGNTHRLILPDLGRIRAGRAHFRGLRLIHTHLKDESLTRDDLSDLALLRLDYIAAISVDKSGLPGRVRGAHLLPGEPSPEPWRLEEHSSPHEINFDFLAIITALETEFSRKVETSADAGDRGKAVLVVVTNRLTFGEDTLLELRELARTADVEVAGAILQVRPSPDSRFVLGKGKLEEVVMETQQKGADLIVFGSNLTPTQAKNIARVTELKIIDRTQLILDIFAGRAHSRDGKLQVELAQLKYRLPRLTHEDTGLSRLAGGIGGQGPGETKLEIDRRRARDRIHRLEKEINRLSDRRGVRRKLRSQNQLPVISIVGYTNVGKSTLLNSLTRSDVLVENKLFATLDPTSRRLHLPQNREVILTDTVGFIRNLPPDLLNAFRATLEELNHSNLLLHLVDASDPRVEDQLQVVSKILDALALDSIPSLVLLNKCDRIDPVRARALARRLGGIPISAQKKEGLGAVLEAITNCLWQQDAASRGLIKGAKQFSSQDTEV